MSVDHLGMDRCNCDGCSVLRTAWSEASLIYENVREPALVRKAAAATGGALDNLLELLHREHMPQCYETKDEGYHSLKDSGRSEEGPPTGWDDCDQDVVTTEQSSTDMSSQDAIGVKDQIEASNSFTTHDAWLTCFKQGESSNQSLDQVSTKFMVCDHCAGHGLCCDESGICEQCELSETVCIHRICKFSPGSKDLCPVSDCCYAHGDHLPETYVYGAEDYIILPGDLPGYLSTGYLLPLERWAKRSSTEGVEHALAVKQMQAEARDRIDAFVSDGGTGLEVATASCGNRCGVGLSEEEILEREEQERMVLETEKEERAAWRMMMRQSADFMAEVGHKNLLQRVPGCGCWSCFDLKHGE
ncbi:hypothetical protein LTR17_008068 [Elasticomyces elasticus]|nr:hypothetical protein LTR17_008068 [Elasticomyces elasticus]